MEVSLVTGGNSGIGYEVVRQFAKEGMVVYLGSRDPEKGIAAATELSSAGDSGYTFGAGATGNLLLAFSVQ
jgi:NAD(P)-dependent dehydrogenase (short-subunit alcohol dehydrogenase family)